MISQSIPLCKEIHDKLLLSQTINDEMRMTRSVEFLAFKDSIVYGHYA